MVALFGNVDPNHQFTCLERKELHESTFSHPKIQSVNQYLDKKNIPLHKDNKMFILKGVSIDNYECSTFFERNHQSLKSLKNELITTPFATTAANGVVKDNLDSYSIVYNQAGFNAHLLFGAVKATFNKLTIIADDHSNGLSCSTPVSYYLSKSEGLPNSYSDLLESVQRLTKK